MLESKINIQQLIAVAAIASMGTEVLVNNPRKLRTVFQADKSPPKVRTYVPKMDTPDAKEIAEWNAKVEATKQAKKARKR